MAKTINLGKVGLTFEGDYDSSKSYASRTCVFYNHVSWTSKKDVPAGIAPGTNDEYWQKVSERGAQGIQGIQGPQGNSAFDGTGVEIVNDLTSGGEAAVLSAEQGKILKTELTELESETSNKLIRVQKVEIASKEITVGMSAFTLNIPLSMDVSDLTIWIEDENSTIIRAASLRAIDKNGQETTIKDSISANAKVVIPNPKSVAKLTMYVGTSFFTGNEGKLKIYAETTESLLNEVNTKVDNQFKVLDSDNIAYFATGASPTITRNDSGYSIKFAGTAFRIYNKKGVAIINTTDFAGQTFSLLYMEQLVFNLETNTIEKIEYSTSNDGNYIRLLVYSGGSLEGLLSSYYVSKSIKDTEDKFDSIDESLVELNYRVDAVSEKIETEYSVPSSGENFSDKIIPIHKGESYTAYFTIDSEVANTAGTDSFADGYFNLKFSDAESKDTLWKIASVVKAQIGEVFTLSFTSDKDVDCIVGSYSLNMNKDFNINVELNRNYSETKKDASDIVAYYNSNLVKERENLRRWSDFKCFFFSDIHASELNFKRIVDLANNYGSTNVECIINTGDTTASIMNEGLDWYNNLVDKSNVPILHAPGNHDAWKDSTWSWASGAEIYDYIVKKVAESVDGIVLPSNAETEGKCYYYKDFGNVRVISLLSVSTSTKDYYFDEAQKTWLTSVLESARTTYHYWKIVSQKPTTYTLQSGDVIKEVLTCDADLNKRTYEYYTEGDIYAVPMSVIIMNHMPFKADKAVRIESNKLHSWDDYRKDVFAKGLLSDRMFVSEEAVAVVANYIENGGSFICWLTGHTHADSVLTHSDHPKQMMININSAKYSNHQDGVSATSSADVNYDSFDYLGVDLKSGMIKVLRIGWAEDSAMRVRRSWCYDYANGVLLSEN